MDYVLGNAYVEKGKNHGSQWHCRTPSYLWLIYSQDLICNLSWTILFSNYTCIVFLFTTSLIFTGSSREGGRFTGLEICWSRQILKKHNICILHSKVVKRHAKTYQVFWFLRNMYFTCILPIVTCQCFPLSLLVPL